MYLDNRIHRTLQLNTDLCNSSDYIVIVTTDNTTGVNTLTIKDHTSATPIASLECKNIFTPPICGTPIGKQYNPNTQPLMGTIDPGQYRIIELHQNLCDNPAIELVVRSTSPTGKPQDAVDTLHYTPAGGIPGVDSTVVTFGDKIPPKLG